MKMILSDHTRKRMRERSLEDEDIRMALLYPDRLEVDRTDNHRLLAKRVYDSKTGTRQLLMVVYEVNNDIVEVVTVISTSKIRKYL